MGLSPHNIARARSNAAGQIENAIKDEIEGLIMGRIEMTGGRLAQMARFRSFVGTVMGNLSRVTDILDMAFAGFHGMTTQRRNTTRVAAAHAYGYWVFQDRGLTNPINPPNSFLIMHRQQDRADAQIGQRTGNSSFSSDDGHSAYDWNSFWRSGVQGCLSDLEDRMYYIFRSGELQSILQNRFGDNAQVHIQTYDQCINQYRTVFLAPGFGSPTLAAGAFLMASLKGEREMEIADALRLYQQFPYAPAGHA